MIVSRVTQRVAIVTDVSGQDGPYLAQLLLEKGYQGYDAYRRTSTMARRASSLPGDCRQGELDASASKSTAHHSRNS